MASTKEFLDFVLEQLAPLDGVTARAMMGEYILYYQGRVVGGVYDDRFLLKATPSALRRMEEAGREALTDIPYPGAKPLLVADVDDAALCCELVRAIAQESDGAARKTRRRAKQEEA